MASRLSDISKGSLAFYTILLIAIIFSIPTVQDFVTQNISIPENVTSCYVAIVKPDLLFPYAFIAFAITLLPATILYSRFIYKKHGVLLTKFNNQYSPRYHFKEFISQGILNKVFGLSAFAVWLCACLFFLFSIALLGWCYLLK